MFITMLYLDGIMGSIIYRGEFLKVTLGEIQTKEDSEMMIG